jgi:hypothetical protein
MNISRTQVKPVFAHLGIALFLLSAPVVFGGQADKGKGAVTSMQDVQCVIGLEGIKNGARGTLSVQGGALRFDQDKNKAQVPISSITDIYVGNESRQDITGAGKVVTMAIPYGGGRFLSLFSHKVEVMTVEYTGANGAFHGAIFVLAQGDATSLKNILVAQGAKTTVHVPEPEEPKDQKEQKP